jgi:hypothetical protein
MAKKCVEKKIRIKGKRGGVIAEFVGHVGPGCKPRRNPTKGVTPGRLKPWAAEMKRAGPACAKIARKGRKGSWSKSAYTGCVRQAMKHVGYSR